MNTPDEIRQTVLGLLGEIAPEADVTVLNPDVSFRDQLDIDSMDFLNFVIMIHKTFGVEIPETDYPKYGTLNSCVEQLSGKRVS
jgi:acyl carrier protein